MSEDLLINLRRGMIDSGVTGDSLNSHSLTLIQILGASTDSVDFTRRVANVSGFSHELISGSSEFTFKKRNFIVSALEGSRAQDKALDTETVGFSFRKGKAAPSGPLAYGWLLVPLMSRGVVNASFETLDNALTGRGKVTFASSYKIMSPMSREMLRVSGSDDVNYTFKRSTISGGFLGFDSRATVYDVIAWAIHDQGLAAPAVVANKATEEPSAPKWIAPVIAAGVLVGVCAAWLTGGMAHLLDALYSLPFGDGYKSIVEKIYDFLYPGWLKDRLSLVDDLDAEGMRRLEPLIEVAVSAEGRLQRATWIPRRKTKPTG